LSAAAVLPWIQQVEKRSQELNRILNARSVKSPDAITLVFLLSARLRENLD